MFSNRLVARVAPVAPVVPVAPVAPVVLRTWAQPLVLRYSAKHSFREEALLNIVVMRLDRSPFIHILTLSGRISRVWSQPCLVSFICRVPGAGTVLGSRDVPRAVKVMALGFPACSCNFQFWNDAGMTMKPSLRSGLPQSVNLASSGVCRP